MGREGKEGEGKGEVVGARVDATDDRPMYHQLPNAHQPLQNSLQAGEGGGTTKSH